MLLIGGAAPPKYVAGGGASGYLSKWTASGSISNSGILQLTPFTYSIGTDTAVQVIVSRDNGRAVGVGYNVITNYDTLSDVTAMGFQALQQVSPGGAFLVGIGDDALGKNTTGTKNTAQGSQSLFGNTIGSDNTADGFQALSTAVTNSDNTAVGSKAGVASRGSRNTFVGRRAFETHDAGFENVAVGYLPDVNFTGDPNSSNVVVGARAFATEQSTVIGHGASAAEQTRFVTLLGIGATAAASTNSTGIGWNSRTTEDNMVRLGNNLTTKTVTTGRYETTNGYASFSTAGTNQIGTTGYTNNGVINQIVYVSATAVSFTVKDRSGTVLYTSPTLTATVNVSLQPGWAINAASGLAGTAVPF